MILLIFLGSSAGSVIPAAAASPEAAEAAPFVASPPERREVGREARDAAEAAKAPEEERRDEVVG